MTNQNKYDFSINTRQSIVAIILLIVKFYKVIVRGALPIIAVFIFGAKDNRALYAYVVIAVVSIIVFVMAILSYYRFYFRIENNELYIEKGVFKKTKLNIPFERIQTVNFEQNILLQIFGKYKVEVDTAGSSKKEFSFDALDKDIAEQLREHILDNKSSREISENKFDEVESVPRIESGAPLFNLSIGDLLKVGITENHLKAGGWLIAVLGYFFSLSNDFGFKIEDEIEKNIEGINLDIVLFIGSFIALLLLFVTISLIRTSLKYYNLRFERMRSGFKIFSGLLNRKEYSAPDNKIQKVAWGDNPLRRIFGIFIIYFKQAKSVEGDRNKSLSVPIMDIKNVDQVLAYLYGDEINEKMLSFGISKHFFIRTFIYFIMLPSMCGVAFGIYLGLKLLVIISILYFIYFSIIRYVQWKKSGFLINDKFLKRKKGVYGDYNEIIPWYKVQSIELIQSIYQRRYDIANLTIHTAAGSTNLPYIPLGQAQKLRDYALYIAESSTKEWM